MTCALYCAVKELEFPESMTQEMRNLLESLLKREVNERLGCMGAGSVFNGLLLRPVGIENPSFFSLKRTITTFTILSH